jgi:Ca-activated chloride channel family protein
MRCPTVMQVPGGACLPGRTWVRQLLRISSTLAVLSIFFPVGIPAERVPQDQANVSITPREKRAAANSNIRLDVKMILVPITVMDPTDRPIENLRPEAFRVFEDDIEQRIVSLSKEEGPVSVGFIFDASSSMKNRMDRSVAAIQQFLQTNMPGDEYFLVRFSDKPTVVTGFTRDPNDILRELGSIQPQGWTALHDAICLGVQRMKSAKNSRRALFVLTDGSDNNSRYTQSEVKNLVVESDVRVYSVGLFERPRFLERLAALTGGQALWAHNLKELPEAIEQISREFRNQYMIGYSSNNPQNDGKYRKVKVELTESPLHKALHLFWRRGYFAPPE